MNGLEAVILGCGSSGGVPRADGAWGACDPDEPKNRRTRCSLLVRRRGPYGQTNVLVDTAPELRQQTAGAGVNHVDAVMFTHDHADQVHGIDDLRAFFLSNGQRVPCFADAATRATLEQRFGYIFQGEGGYPAIAELMRMPANGTHWTMFGHGGPVEIVAFDQDHGAVRSLGFRFGPIAYSSDVVGIPEESFALLAGAEIWIVDALRWTPHPTHAHVGRALEWIERVKPRRAVLTNLHIDLDYATLAAELPDGVEPAYDGMVLRPET